MGQQKITRNDCNWQLRSEKGGKKSHRSTALIQMLFLHEINSAQMSWSAKEEQRKKRSDGAIVPPHSDRSPLSLCVGCSASSPPEGCFPNHINEGAMLQPPLRRHGLYSGSSPIYTVPILIWQPWSRNRKIKPLRPLSINLESYPNTVVRGWLAITNVSVFNELFHQKQKRHIKYLFRSKLFQRGVLWGCRPYGIIPAEHKVWRALASSPLGVGEWNPS